MTSCIFCGILSGETPASFVYRDERVAAFMDIQPITLGHLLVVPTAHGAHLADIDEEIASDLMRCAYRLSAAVRGAGVPCEGVNLFLADGAAAMQDVFHVHLHVIPRFGGDGFGLVLPSDYPRRPTRDELDGVAAQIRAALDGTRT